MGCPRGGQDVPIRLLGCFCGSGVPCGIWGSLGGVWGGHSGVWVSPSVPGCPRVSPRVPVGDQDIPMGLRDGIRGLPRATGGLGVASRCHRGRGGAAQPGDVLGDMRQQLEEREHALQLARDTIQVSASQIPAPGAIPGGHEDSPGGHGDSPGGHTRHWPGPRLYSQFFPVSPQFPLSRFFPVPPSPLFPAFPISRFFPIPPSRLFPVISSLKFPLSLLPGFSRLLLP